MQHALKWFAVFTTLIMVVVLLGGALVTKTESGAGCGDSWPLCHGELIPSDITFELIVELSHRLVSGLAGFTVLILSVWSWKKIGHIRETKFLALLSVFFLVLQALIGAAAVMWGQSDAILALHFGISLISFASVLLLTLLIFEIDKKFDAKSLVINKDMKFHMVGIIVYSYVVVYTGAYVRHKGASLACPEWPLCSNRAGGLPTTLHEWIQMGHRFAAGIIFIWIAYAAWRAIKHYKHEKVIYWGWIIAFILVSMQVTSGALVVITGLNLYIALVHALIISCLFGLLSYFLLLVSRSNTNIEVDSSSDQSLTK
ncbi:cytochrome c oxidase assembly protein subunit 15 [Metabacillus crassostreae]|uniref:COX15/CtaA family protein n=1 Tax=Metabacillus crassostreae TaxID=929098 RepID=UPI00195B57E2|nr:heme A synthase [Metabacillus crassostreae]MBM7603468.1 cytochrome c oxidase assembly protein subunit 15 [Metabacillus crassostreae]